MADAGLVQVLDRARVPQFESRDHSDHPTGIRLGTASACGGGDDRSDQTEGRCGGRLALSEGDQPPAWEQRTDRVAKLVLAALDPRLAEIEAKLDARVTGDETERKETTARSENDEWKHDQIDESALERLEMSIQALGKS